MSVLATFISSRSRFALGLLLAAWSGPGASPIAASPVAHDPHEKPTLPGEVMQAIHGAAGRDPTGEKLPALRWESLGATLGDYASNPGANPLRFESTRLAARRILAEGATSLQTPDQTARWLTAAALRLDARAAAPGLRADERRDANCQAHIARFHAARLVAAVHYNLFRRALSLAELYAATQLEKRAVAHWRALVAIAGEHPDAARWRDELQHLEAGLRELENECCPPTAAHLAAPIWRAPGS